VVVLLASTIIATEPCVLPHLVLAALAARPLQADPDSIACVRSPIL
jgi:hypothetical protein